MAFGFCFGLALSAPIGPVNVICLRRTLADGFGAGIAAGLGAAVADALYAVAAAFGAGAFAALVSAHAGPIRVVGGVLLLGFAAVLWRHEPRAGMPHARGPYAPVPRGPALQAQSARARTSHAARPREAGPAAGARLVANARGFATSFLLTLSNPLPALSLGAAFGLGGGLADGVAPFVAGVLAGAMLWWVALAAVASATRRHVGGDALRLVSRVSAVVLSLFGLAALAASA